MTAAAVQAAPGAPPKPRRKKGLGGLYYSERLRLWAFAVELRRGADGKRRRRVVYGHTEAEVKRRVADLKAQGGGSLRPVVPTRLAEYASQWLADSKKRVRPSTLESYRWAWGHAEPLIGGVRIDRFDRATVLELFEQMERRGASPNTVRHVARVLQTLVEDATAEGLYVGVNPFTTVRRQKPKHKPEKGRALSVAEAKRFIQAAREDRLEAAWILGLTCGLRIGEMLGLQWNDVNFKLRTLFVQRQAQFLLEDSDDADGGSTRRGGLVIADLKTADSRRLLPLGALAIEALQRRKLAADLEPASEWIFPSVKPDVPISPNNARRRNFAETKARAKLDGAFTPHDLRHTFSSLGNMVGVSEKVRSELLGHSDSAITRTTYTHSVEGEARSAADKIDSLVAE